MATLSPYISQNKSMEVIGKSLCSQTGNLTTLLTWDLTGNPIQILLSINTSLSNPAGWQQLAKAEYANTRFWEEYFRLMRD